MFYFLGFVLIIIIAVFVIGLSIIGTIFRALFGFGRRTSNPNGSTRSHTQTSSTQQTYTRSQKSTDSNTVEEEEITENNPRPRHKKVFGKDEGEYVDYEEIK